MKAGAEYVTFSTGLAAAIAALLLIGFVQPAGAQACKDLPFGPAKKQCLMENRPEAFQKKQERCKALADQRGGALEGRGTGKKSFVQSCMQGKVNP